MATTRRSRLARGPRRGVAGRRTSGRGEKRVLLVHARPLDGTGGAEISLRHHVAHAPAGVRVDVILPTGDADLASYDAVVLANVRPHGAATDEEKVACLLRWAERLERHRGWSIKSERDAHPCAKRDASCVAVDPIRRLPCDCARDIPAAVERLYNACSAVQFVTPAHRQVINQIVSIRTRQFVVASPIDFELFRSVTPYERRRRAALIFGEGSRVAPTAEARALAAGFEPVRVRERVAYERMPALYNAHQAVVVDPTLFHASGRAVVEGLACGCRVLAGPRVGFLSFPDPCAASRAANREFWRMVLGGEAGSGGSRHAFAPVS
jgi:hypothetical protein